MEVDYRPNFEEQRTRYSFCFTCEDCAHFDGETGECLHGFPNEQHRLSYYVSEIRPGTILFCKDFDLA